MIMKKYNRDGIMVLYLSCFLIIGTYLASYSTTITGFLITLGLFSVFGIGGCMWMLKNITLQPHESGSHNLRNVRGK